MEICTYTYVGTAGIIDDEAALGSYGRNALDLYVPTVPTTWTAYGSSVRWTGTVSKEIKEIRR